MEGSTLDFGSSRIVWNALNAEAWISLAGILKSKAIRYSNLTMQWFVSDELVRRIGVMAQQEAISVDDLVVSKSVFK
jgi:phage gp46-like protein